MALIAVCLSSYCFGIPFFTCLFFLQSMTMVPSIIIVLFGSAKYGLFYFAGK